MVSIIDLQRDMILDKINQLTSNDWKILILDQHTKKIVDNVMTEDDILRLNISEVGMLEKVRDPTPMAAIYLLHPLDYTVECVLDDFRRRRYSHHVFVWTAAPGVTMEKIRSANPRVESHQLLVDWYPRESHVVTFRDKKSFLTLYHPLLDNRVQNHVKDLAKKIAAVCIALGERPLVRRFRPRTPHDARDLSYHLAKLVIGEFNKYEAAHGNTWYSHSSRSPGLLLVVDRSMDLAAPLVHEFTYQAMAHDVLKVHDDDKVTFRFKINEGTAAEEGQDGELTDKDKVWVDLRHRQMADTIDKLQGDFQKFMSANPQFQDKPGSATISDIRDMMGGLPQFTQLKNAYSLHLAMVQGCTAKFQENKLAAQAGLEQSLAVGLDVDGRKPKETLEELVRLIDDEALPKLDKLRLILLWIMHRDGIISDDVRRLLAHAQLAVDEEAVVESLANLGFKNKTDLKEQRPPRERPFPPKAEPVGENDNSLARFETTLKALLTWLCDSNNPERQAQAADNDMWFPFEPPLSDPSQDPMKQAGEGQSLRRAEPRWARAGRGGVNKVDINRQRIIVFVAGGATYSEARACYETGARYNKDVYLVTPCMITPRDYVAALRHLAYSAPQLEDFLYEPKPKRPELLSQPPPPQAPVHPSHPPHASYGQQPPPPNGAAMGVPPGSSGSISMGGSWQPTGGPPIRELDRMNLQGGGPSHHGPSAPYGAGGGYGAYAPPSGLPGSRAGSAHWTADGGGVDADRDRQGSSASSSAPAAPGSSKKKDKEHKDKDKDKKKKRWFK